MNWMFIWSAIIAIGVIWVVAARGTKKEHEAQLKREREQQLQAQNPAPRMMTERERTLALARSLQMTPSERSEEARRRGL